MTPTTSLWLQLRQTVPDENDDAFLGAFSIGDMVTRQRGDSALRQEIPYLGGQASAIPRALKRVVHALTLQDNVLYEGNFAAGGRSWLLVVPDNLRHEIVEACHDDLTSGHLGYCRTLARLLKKY